ncbi:lipase family protein [Nocardia transvalensis]|uniref:lipase family protein n=1 Tax=Nocardia transvalensis TaxID=37333 RepID=UPI00189387F1|nr:alpha/beta fold hydrolase [Nocardia transvalensis]MBF6331149.1 alpha/beta hydrolase [Nocardia transvalensis]
MQVIRGGTTALAVVAALAAAVLAVPAGPAAAETPGTLMGETAQPDGFHGMSGGSVITYWTTGSDGAPRPASGALFVPPGTPPPGGWPIIAFDHGTTGLGRGCGAKSDPSTAPQSFWNDEEDELMRHLVSRGFALVAPDYLGLGLFDTGPHPYLELRTEAAATIDMVHAVRSAHADLSRTWAVVGLSQGGQAALGTGYFQSRDAADLDFRGTVAVDPESDIEKILPIAGPQIPAIPGTDGSVTYVTYILAGLRAARPDVGLDQYLSPLGRTVLNDIVTLCKPAIEDRVRGLSIGQLLAKPLSDTGIRDALTSYMAVPTSGYDAPILLFLNLTDTEVPSPVHVWLAEEFAANGVDFRTVTGTGRHVQLNPQMWSALDDFLANIR